MQLKSNNRTYMPCCTCNIGGKRRFKKYKLLFRTRTYLNFLKNSQFIFKICNLTRKVFGLIEKVLKLFWNVHGFARKWNTIESMLVNRRVGNFILYFFIFYYCIVFYFVYFNIFYFVIIIFYLFLYFNLFILLYYL